MDKSKYLKEIAKLGYLTVPYSVVKLFGSNTALVLARINTEYINAYNKKYLICENIFSFNEAEMASSLGFTIDEVKTSIKQLEDLRLIKTRTIKSFNLILLYLDKICEYISNAERKNNFQMWNEDIDTLQRAAFTELKLKQENLKLVEDIINEDYQLAVDENGNPLCF